MSLEMEMSLPLCTSPLLTKVGSTTPIVHLTDLVTES